MPIEYKDQAAKWGAVCVTLLMAALGHSSWLNWTISGLSERVLHSTEQIVELKETVKLAAEDRYRGSDARRDMERIDAVHRELRMQIQALEMKLKP